MKFKHTQLAKRHKTGLSCLNGSSDLHNVSYNLHFCAKFTKQNGQGCLRINANAIKRFRKAIRLDENGQKTSKWMQPHCQNGLKQIKMATGISISGTQIIKKNALLAT